MTATRKRRRSAKTLGLSEEVAYYLKARDYPSPDCPPAIVTPEPVDVPGAVFDVERVDKVIRAMRQLRHTQGDYAGQPLEPDPWQVAYIIAPSFGWVAPNDAGVLRRIIRTLYVDVPRKNGKTTLAGGVAIYLTAGDGEEGAQVYAVAAGKDQARFCFDPVKAIAERSPHLAPHVKTLRDRIVHPRSSSYFAVVSSVADLLHGANVHGAVIDELHVHRTGAVVEAVRTGTGSRSQPLIAMITTADDGRQATVYAQTRDYCEKLAKGVLHDPAWRGVVWAAGEDDDPFAEATWRKANPGYGISPTRAFMAAAANEARQSPAQLSSFKRLHLGVRTKQVTTFLDLKAWDRCAPQRELDGLDACGALDLATTTDLTAWALVFPDGAGGYDALWRHYLPEAALLELDRRTAGEASVWVRDGWLTITPGNVVDYQWVRRDVNADRERFKVVEVGYDPWNATSLVTDLQGDGCKLVHVRQGFATMSTPTKELLKAVLEGKFRHGGNPLVRWQVDHLAVSLDPAGNVKPDKARSPEKIDGLVAGIMAVDSAMRRPVPKVSAYAKRGLTIA
jgi:phage terminase large subunit-like protein